MIFCLVEGCQVWATIWNNLQVHFVHRHMSYTLVILEEGNQNHPLYPKCYMFVPGWALNGHHISTEIFRRGYECKY